MLRKPRYLATNVTPDLSAPVAGPTYPPGTAPVAYRGPWRTQPGSVLVNMGDTIVLFFAHDQSIHELDPLSAYVWQAVEEGLIVEDIELEMCEAGLETSQAKEFTQHLLSYWLSQNLITPSIRRLHSKTEIASRQTQSIQSQIIEAGGCRMRIRYTGMGKLKLAEIFSGIATTHQRWSVTFDVTDDADGNIVLLREGRSVNVSTKIESAVALKSTILTEVLCRAHYAIALHAAALILDDSVILLCGSPGAGKSCLTLAAVNSGWGYGSDDVTVLDSSGSALGLPLPIAIKKGGQHFGVSKWPTIREAMPWRRPDGQILAYAAIPAAPQNWRPVAAIVALDRKMTADAHLTPMDPTETLGALLSGAYIEGDRLTPGGFEALTSTITNAQCFRMTYSDLPEALLCLRGLFR